MLTYTPIAMRVINLGEDAFHSTDTDVQSFVGNVFTMEGVYEGVEKGRIDLSRVFEEIDDEYDVDELTMSQMRFIEDEWLNNGWVG